VDDAGRVKALMTSVSGGYDLVSCMAATVRQINCRDKVHWSGSDRPHRRH